ncbi:hypothetical protein LPTSP4_09010 [Leptospira ryugenii]|uniref:Uncharacterized protein n=1 Tax=Leptospira ryugenii TaxID=1917863 RepID=A0A2P2DXM3_9LEPT|nr:hypothetical protein [Leptospira ryugenii]GBF49388.1 hypothetical protein LPTSP4_09010 [Leptospira ryugenii]
MTNEQKISRIIEVLDKVERFVSGKMPGDALLNPELKAIRKDIKELKSQEA